MEKIKLKLFSFNNTKLVIALTSVIYVLLVISIFPRSYLAYDNYTIAEWVEYGLDPYYLTILLGRILIFFYKLKPDIAWFGVFLYITHTINIYLITRFIYALKTKLISKISFHVFTLITYALLILRLDFTTTSFMLAFSSLLNGYRCIINKNTQCFFISSVLMGFSYLIRPESTFGAILFLMPLIIYFVLKKKINKNYILTYLLPIAAFIVVNYTLTKVTTTEKYNEILDFHKARSSVLDYKMSDNWKNDELLAINGWSNKDANAFLNWFFFDKSTFNKKKITEFHEKYKISKLTISINEIKNNSKYYYLNYRYHTILSLVLLVSIVILLRKKSLGWLLYFMYYYAGILALLYFFRFPYEVSDPVFMILYIVLLAVIMRNTNKATTVTLISIYLVVCVVLTFSIWQYYRWNYHNYYGWNTKNIKDFNLKIELLEKKGGKYIIFGGTGFAYADPLKICKSDSEFQFIDALPYSELTYIKLKRIFNVDSEKELLQNLRGLKVIAREEYIDMVLDYINSKYNIQYNKTFVTNFIKDDKIYQIHY